MIKTFKNKETEAIFQGYVHPNFPQDIIRTAKRKLQMIDAACTLMDLRVPPANRLEVLKGNRSTQHSIRINKQWRICFVWENNNAYDVEIIDYH